MSQRVRKNEMSLDVIEPKVTDKVSEKDCRLLYLDLAAEMLKKSWQLLPSIHEPHISVVFNPERIKEHWMRQSELQLTMVRNWHFSSSADFEELTACQIENNFFELMSNEQKFLIYLQDKLSEDLFSPDGRSDDYLKLLEQVIKAQAFVGNALQTALRAINNLSW